MAVWARPKHYIFARIFGVKVNRFYLFFNYKFSLLRYNPMAGTLEQALLVSSIMPAMSQ